MKKNIATLFLLSIVFYTGCSNKQAGTEGSVKVAAKDSGDINYIYLTFDDGPLEGSEDIDNAVRTEKIKVNVFVVGQHALNDERMRGFYKLYQQNPFIEIGNHSFSHAHNHYKKFYDSSLTVVADFKKCQDTLHIPNKLARLPGRNQWRLKDTTINDVKSGSASADILYKEGFKIFGWDLEWQHDKKTGVPIQTVDDMVELIEKKLNENKTVTPRHLVLLSHDEMFRNGWEESELKELVEKLKLKGNFRFEHLSNYPG